MSYHPSMQFATLPEIAPDAHRRISQRPASLNGVDATQVTFHVGAKWSEDLRDYAGTVSPAAWSARVEHPSVRLPVFV